MKRALAWLGVIAVAVAQNMACSTQTTNCVGSAPADFDVTIAVDGEDATAPLSNATVLGAGAVRTADGNGSIVVSGLSAPAALIVKADGYLSEPVVVGPADITAPVHVRLLATKNRVVIHSAGDVMLGRRYETPTAGTPLIPLTNIAGGAQQVVTPVKDVFTAADFRTLNFETTVTNRDEEYPGKRFILRTRPDALAGLAALQPSAVGVANNHQRDYMDIGVGDTIAALAAHGLPFTGVSADATAPVPISGNANGTRIGVLAYTTVDGDFVNDSYPAEADAPPAALDPADAFQYVDRSWGFTGGAVTIATATQRIGPAWKLFGTATATVSLADEGAAWGSMAGVYPEMQDWVQRRGHGGARPFTEPSDRDGAGSPGEIADLKKNADLVIVQLHAGFQFEEAAGENVVTVAQHAIDAGADIVIAHHPHILQGLGFYKNKLIAFSLGNFVFDQDFLSTFGSVMLRTVWEGSNMIEARLVPVEIESYVPRFSTGVAAQNDLLTLNERSQLQARTSRVADGSVQAHLLAATDGVTPASLVYDHGTAKVVPDAPVADPRSITVAANAISAVDPPALCQGDLGTTDSTILVGRDMFGWGRFEPELAGQAVGRTHWDIGTCDKDIVSNGGATGQGYLRLRREAGDSDVLLARPIARIPLFHHRFFGDNDQPIDPDPTYSLHFAARRTGSAKMFARIELYHFDDTDPTEDPESDPLGSTDIPFTPGTSFGVQDLDLDIADLDSGNGNVVFVYFGLAAPDRGTAYLDVDDVAFVEWRTAVGNTQQLLRADFVKNTSASATTLQIPCVH